MRYVLEPEVAGELGTNTILDTLVHPPIIHYLHFIFKGWLGDDLIECFPIYLVSENLGHEFLKNNLSGFELKQCLIEVSDEMDVLQQKTKLPTFLWLTVGYGETHKDFFINKRNKLNVSEKAYSIIEKFNLNFCDITKEP